MIESYITVSIHAPGLQGCSQDGWSSL